MRPSGRALLRSKTARTILRTRLSKPRTVCESSLVNLRIHGRAPQSGVRVRRENAVLTGVSLVAPQSGPYQDSGGVLQSRLHLRYTTALQKGQPVWMPQSHPAVLMWHQCRYGSQSVSKHMEIGSNKI